MLFNAPAGATLIELYRESSMAVELKIDPFRESREIFPSRVEIYLCINAGETEERYLPLTKSLSISHR